MRTARVDDVDSILRLVNYYATKGMMLPKTAFKVYKNLQNYFVVERDSSILACASLVVLWRDLAEICSLAVDEKYQRQGIGRKLVQKCMEKAKELNVPKVIVLTYRDEFFEKMGFYAVDKDSFPRKLMWECLECPKLEHCDEQAYVIDLK
ncbi:MAG: N-acetyltransferase [Deltaproteobacteria bacterium]|nr:N-acetyltransferase [Deltaproteobacteria bacterium]MBW2120381.1 N-acetyltransferase [Deltaproteobacteria bacterium]